MNGIAPGRGQGASDRGEAVNKVRVKLGIDPAAPYCGLCAGQAAIYAHAADVGVAVCEDCLRAGKVAPELARLFYVEAQTLEDRAQWLREHADRLVVPSFEDGQRDKAREVALGGVEEYGPQALEVLRRACMKYDGFNPDAMPFLVEEIAKAVPGWLASRQKPVAAADDEQEILF
jgi:hypothetical protein